MLLLHLAGHGLMAFSGCGETQTTRQGSDRAIVLRLRTPVPVFGLSSPDSSLGSGQTSILVLLASHRLDILCLDFLSPEAALLFASLIQIDRG